MEVLSAFDALDGGGLPLQLLLEPVKLAAHPHLVEVPILAVQLPHVLRLPSADASQDAQVAVAAADLEVRQVEPTHLVLFALQVIVLEQALADVEQLGLAQVLWVGRAVLGRKERSKWRGREGDLDLMEVILKGKDSLPSCHMCSSYSGMLKLVCITKLL
jgi:hypothetical protein